MLRETARVPLLELVVVPLQIPHKLLDLDRGLVGEAQNLVATLSIEQRVERQTDAGPAPEQSSFASMLLVHGLPGFGRFRGLACLLINLGSGVADVVRRPAPVALAVRLNGFGAVDRLLASIAGFIAQMAGFFPDLVTKPARGISGFVRGMSRAGQDIVSRAARVIPRLVRRIAARLPFAKRGHRCLDCRVAQRRTELLLQNLHDLGTVSRREERRRLGPQ